MLTAEVVIKECARVMAKDEALRYRNGLVQV